MTETPDDLEQSIPDGWVRETHLAGMGRVHESDFTGGFKCDPCDHFVPIDAVDEDTCPLCGTTGLIGTVIMGVQEQTFLYPEGFVDGDGDEDGGEADE